MELQGASGAVSWEEVEKAGLPPCDAVINLAVRRSPSPRGAVRCGLKPNERVSCVSCVCDERRVPT
jgi:hypothetical protein